MMHRTGGREGERENQIEATRESAVMSTYSPEPADGKGCRPRSSAMHTIGNSDLGMRVDESDYDAETVDKQTHHRKRH